MASEKQSSLQTKLLDVGYDGKRLIEGVNFAVEAGSIVTLIGPNGSGKSTILKTLASYLEPLGGTTWISGRPIQELSDRERALELSVMLTERLRTELLTCEDIVEAGRYPHTGRLGVLSEEDHKVVHDAMKLVGVWDLRERDFMQISDGQRQRVLLARAVCQSPRVLLLDEPTSYLDIRYQIDLLEILKLLARERDVAVLMSLHELQLARIASDWLICVKGPEIFAQGTPDDIFTTQVINELYDLEDGCYNPATGEVRLPSSVLEADLA